MTTERDAAPNDFFDFVKETICTLSDAEAEDRLALPHWAAALRDEACRLLCLHGDRARTGWSHSLSL